MTTNIKLNDSYQIRDWMSTVPAQDNWLLGEPSIHEILSDPIVHLVMRRDNVGPADVWAAIDRGRATQRGREEPSRNVA